MAEPAFGSSAYWLATLNTLLTQQAVRVQHLEAYYRGDHNLAFASNKFREAFGGLFTSFADNFCRLVPDAVHERLTVQGFRMGTNQPADDAAWRIWQANGLDVKSSQAFREALIKGEAAFSVWAGPDPKTPLIRVETADQMVVSIDPGSGQRLAALKRWVGIDGHYYVTLFLPDRVEKYRSDAPASKIATPVVVKVNGAETETVDAGFWKRYDRWEKRQMPGEEWPIPNPLKVVPVIPIINMPRLDGTGEAEHQAVMPLQDAINKEVADMLVASEFAAFRQKWATGVEIPTDETTGEPIEDMRAAVSRAWMTDNKDARFGDFEATDLDNYTKAIEMLIQHVATISRTPPHYLLSTGVMPNDESQAAAETGLIAKVKDRMRDYSEPLEEMMRLAFRIAGDEEKASVIDSEVIWANPEYRSVNELMNALMLEQKLGVPNEILWEKIGYSPQQIERIKAISAQAQIEAAAAFGDLLNAGTITTKPTVVPDASQSDNAAA